MEEIYTLEDKIFREPKQIVYTDDEFTIVRHPHPIAKHHFVASPTKPSPIRLESLQKLHLPLLKRMKWRTKMIVERVVGADRVRLHYGFPTEPTFLRLHLHVFSEDLQNVKSAVQLNSVATNFFVNIDKVLHELEDKGTVQLPTQDHMNDLLFQDVNCSECDESFEELDELDDHMKVQHGRKRESPLVTNRKSPNSSPTKVRRGNRKN